MTIDKDHLLAGWGDDQAGHDVAPTDLVDPVLATLNRIAPLPEGYEWYYDRTPLLQPEEGP